jgi:ABC-type transport system substrate-binding protein
LFGLSGCSNNPYPPGATARSILYQSISEDPTSLDPSVSYTVSESHIVSLIYPGYFRYHYLKRNPFVLELNLGAAQPKREPYVYEVAEKGRKVTRRGESWTFRIKKGLRFQNDPCFPNGKGREINAADFIYSFRRMADPTVPCPILSYFESTVIGLHDYADYNRGRVARKLKTDYTREVEGDPHDPYVFRVLLTHPYPQLRYLMTMAFTTPIPHEAVETYKSNFARHPVGSGPYVLAEYYPRLKLVLKKNPNRNYETYPSDGMPGDREAGLLKDAGKQLPLNDEIVFRILKESLTTWNFFLQGYLDVGDSYDFGPTSVSQVTTRQGGLTKDMQDRGVQIRRAPNPDVWYFAFNMRDPVVGGYGLDKKKLRQAISLAFSAQTFIDVDLQGNATPAQFLIPPCVTGYDPAYRNPYSQYNVAKAKKLLSEAGYPDGISRKTGERLTIYFDNYATGPGATQALGQISKFFDPIGIHMESRSYRYPVWYDKFKHRDYQFAMAGWVADYPDPENFALLLYGPDEKNEGPNDCVYDNPEYNRLFQQMQTMDDGPERQRIIDRMRDIAVEDCPCVFLYHDNILVLYNKWLSNVKPHPVANDYSKYYRVDGPLRAQMQKEWNKPNYWPVIVAAVFVIAGTLPAVAVVRKRRNRRIRVKHGGTA